jgi:hypothetical protein
VKLPRLLDRAADRAVTGPRDMTRHHAEMPYDGNALARHGFDDEGLAEQ